MKTLKVGEICQNEAPRSDVFVDQPKKSAFSSHIEGGDKGVHQSCREDAKSVAANGNHEP